MISAHTLARHAGVFAKRSKQFVKVADKMGFHGFQPALMQILYAVDDEPRSVSDVARQVGMTQQGAGKLIRDAEARGMVKVSINEKDVRAKQVRITRVGVSLRRRFEDLCLKEERNG
jgi:DNA-binding MarR family transcriptional regulator